MTLVLGLGVYVVSPSVNTHPDTDVTV